VRQRHGAFRRERLGQTEVEHLHRAVSAHLDIGGLEIAVNEPSTAWKLRTTGEKWYAGETTSVAIRQGQVSVRTEPLLVSEAAWLFGRLIVGDLAKLTGRGRSARRPSGATTAPRAAA
jgi:hypothetical protein